MSRDMFGESTMPETTNDFKYPALTADYESVNVPGLYFAGTITHGRDFRKSSGGIIHGFRYTAKALFNILNVRIEKKPWPTTKIIKGSAANIRKALLKRINEAPALYQVGSSWCCCERLV